MIVWRYTWTSTTASWKILPSTDYPLATKTLKSPTVLVHCQASLCSVVMENLPFGDIKIMTLGEYCTPIKVFIVFVIRV